MVAKPTVGTFVNPSHALATGLSAAYLFNEGSGTTAADSSGNGEDMSLNGTYHTWTTTVCFTSGAALQAALTAGTERGVIAPALPNIPGGAGFSIEWWLQDDGGDTYAALLSGSGNVGLKLNSNKLIWDQGTIYSSAGNVNASTPYQLVLTYDLTNFRFYINGTLDATVASTNTIDTNPVNVFNDAGSETFKGIADLLRIWGNRVLNGTEVGDLYTTPFDMYSGSLVPHLERQQRGVARGVKRGT